MQTTEIAYDIELMRPGCVVVAAGMGADTKIVQLFETKYWLEFPTPGMKVYRVTEEQLMLLIAKTEAAWVE